MASISSKPKVLIVLATLAEAACVSGGATSSATQHDATFYTVTAEIALTRHEPRIAALEYSAAAEIDHDAGLLRRASEVTTECLQPSLTADVAARWIAVDPSAVDAHRAAARAALDLHRIEQAATQYRAVLDASPRNIEGEFAALETELGAADNVYGARQVADRLAAFFPASPAALRIQAFAALRADDPAAAALDFAAAIARATQAAAGRPAGDGVGARAPEIAADEPGATPAQSGHQLAQGLLRARILAGDVDAPLAEAKGAVEREGLPENRLDYALGLLAAQQDSAARTQLSLLVEDTASKPIALRLLGLLDFQDGRFDDAAARFAELVTSGKFGDDGFFYLGMIAERRRDAEHALRLYAQVQRGENAVPALLRASAILRANGDAPTADAVLDQLVIDEPQRAPEILAARARLYADAGDLSAAVAVLTHGEDEYPDSVELRYAMASMADEQGRTAVALHELQAIAALRPGDPAALNAYGFTLADHRKRLGLARELIERAHAAAPANPAILDSLGWVLYRQGHGEQGLPYLRAAYAGERDGDVAAHLGEVLWQLGRRADAETIWSEASRVGPENRLLNATRVRLHASN